jgi:hypothetical protein
MNRTITRRASLAAAAALFPACIALTPAAAVGNVFVGVAAHLLPTTQLAAQYGPQAQHLLAAQYTPQLRGRGR